MAIGSVVDYLKKNGQNSSFGNRKKLATEYGISNYKGTASQNISLLNKLKSGASTNSNNANLGTSTQNNTVPGVVRAEPHPNSVSNTANNTRVNSGYSYKSADNLTKPIFTRSRETNDYESQLKRLENNKPDDFDSKYTQQIDNILSSINNPKKFDINTDENYKQLYENMREKYLYDGQKAMRDAQGQISSLSGGYGSSYAGSVASQAYDDYMTRLNNNNMALYQMAYDEYWRNRNDNYNQLEAYRGQDNIDYSRYRDTIADYYRDKEYLANRYDTSYNRDYGLYGDALNQYNQESRMAFEQEEARRNQANMDREFNYRQEQDRLANEMAMSRMNARGSGSSGGGRSSSGGRSSKAGNNSVDIKKLESAGRHSASVYTGKKAEINNMGHTDNEETNVRLFGDDTFESKYKLYKIARQKYEKDLEMLERGDVGKNQNKIYALEDAFTARMNQYGIPSTYEMLFATMLERERLKSNRKAR